MTVKITLSVNVEIAKKIKIYAAKNKTTVSKIAEDPFNVLTRKTKPKVKSFADKYAGTLHHHIPDIDRAKEDYLKEKYGI